MNLEKRERRNHLFVLSSVFFFFRFLEEAGGCLEK